MRIRRVLSALSIALLFAFALPSRSEELTNMETSTRPAKRKTVVGYVKDYKAGKVLTVMTPADEVDTFRLDDVETSLWLKTRPTIGEEVKVVESTDARGRTTLTVDAQRSTASRR